MSEKKIINQGNIKIELPDDEGIIAYSNFAIVSHSPEEVVIDFARILPGRDEAKIVSRIIMTPKNAKMFADAIHSNVQNYEKKFGEIIIPNTPQSDGVVQ